MRVEINANVLTVETDIPVTVVEKGLADLTAYDDRQNPVYAIKVNPDGKGNLSQYGIISNAIINDKLGVVIVERIGFTRDDFKKKYGESIIAAHKYCPIIAGVAATKEQLIDSVFGDAAE